MKWVFWSSALLILYAYLGYPALLYLRSRWKPWAVRRTSTLPPVSIVMAVHNGGSVLRAKLDNLSKLDYPAELVEVVVVSDGSSDETNEILREWQGERRRAIILPKNVGKAVALNRAVEAAANEMLIFTDARQFIDRGAIRHLVENFADPSVACVSGELVLSESGVGASSSGLGLYWEFEKKLRQWESATGSVVGVTGALYAARKQFVPSVPPGTILDDVYIPVEAAGRGKRVLFESCALSYDRLADGRHEFWRKVRTLAGNYQLLQLAPWLVTTNNPIRFRFVSHKLARLLVPFALLGVSISSALLRAPFYKLALAGELALCLCAVLGAIRLPLGFLSRPGNACAAFLVLNAAAVVAFAYFVTGRRVAWTR
ncbi:MAG TPA: glycosyltransferase family 2 protein [Terriglobia bacterium]|nr:glycosyltransferase family 2 protein [Terriglobia bacterium]